MKKALMGTTALVAAAVTTGVAADEMMAEPISLTIGGNSHWGIAVVDNEEDSDTTDDVAISNDVELRFHGKTILDNGVEVGIRIEIEGESSDKVPPAADEQGDETYMYLEGSFGTIRIGNDDPAAAQMGTAAPYATYFYGINTPFWTTHISSGGSITTFAHANTWNDPASVMYFSPVINGFQFGLSYAPEHGSEARSGTASRAKGNELVSIGGRYDGAVGDAGVTVAGGYTSKDMEGTGATVTDWAAGVVVSMSGVSVGGAYRSLDDDSGADETIHFDAGIMYGEGPWTVSLNYGNASQDSEDVDTDFARLMGTYSIGPGISLAGVLGSDSPASNQDTTFAGVAMAISF